jgi:hypothetical protein
MLRFSSPRLRPRTIVVYRFFSVLHASLQQTHAAPRIKRQRCTRNRCGKQRKTLVATHRSRISPSRQHEQGRIPTGSVAPPPQIKGVILSRLRCALGYLGSGAQLNDCRLCQSARAAAPRATRRPGLMRRRTGCARPGGREPAAGPRGHLLLPHAACQRSAQPVVLRAGAAVGVAAESHDALGAVGPTNAIAVGDPGGRLAYGGGGGGGRRCLPG